MAVSYDYYRIFYFVAKYRSFTRAAAILMSSQPNVTRTINLLESALGCTLFVRSNRGVALTPEGEALYAHIRLAQEQISAGEQAVASARSLQSGSVSVGTSETALLGLLLPVLRRYHLTYPGIRIRLTNHSTPQAIAALQSGLVELAVVTTPLLPAQSRPGLRQTHLADYQDILIGGPHFAALAGRPQPLEALCRLPLVCMDRSTHTYEFYSDWFARHHLLLQPDIEVATADQILPLVKNDLGLGFLPTFFAADAVARGEVFRIPTETPIPPRSICLLTARGPLSLAAQALAAMLRDTAACAG